jgi:hypothetical protein
MKRLLLLFCIALMAFDILAEDSIPNKNSNPPVPQGDSRAMDKVYFGGGFGLSFGSYTRIAIYPMVGYKFTPKLSAGVELGYEYISTNRNSQSFNLSNYGGSLFARYRVIPQLFLHAEYAMYNYELIQFDNSTERNWVPFLFLGGGYSQNIGPRTWLNAYVKFDVLQNPNSPYADWTPFWGIGVSHGF